MNSTIDFTICSRDEDHYNLINTTLKSPTTEWSKMIVTSLTTKCAIIILHDKDYISINSKKYYFDKCYSDLNADTFSYILLEMIKEDGFLLQIDSTQRLVFIGEEEFVIDEVSYNVSLLTGFYNSVFPIKSIKNNIDSNHYIEAKSVGFYLSTPILYLLSNVGQHSYRSDNKKDFSILGARIVMRLNNSYSANYPIVVNNGEFQIDIISNDLSDLQFTLVDANMHEIKLLSPMFLTINVTGVQDEYFNEVYKNQYVPPTNQQQK